MSTDEFAAWGVGTGHKGNIEMVTVAVQDSQIGLSPAFARLMAQQLWLAADAIEKADGAKHD